VQILAKNTVEVVLGQTTRLNACIRLFKWIKENCIFTHIYSHRTIVHYRYSDGLELEDAVHTAILTLKESFEGQMTEDNIEIGICDHNGFRRLSPPEIKDYLASVQWFKAVFHRTFRCSHTFLSDHLYFFSSCLG